MSIGGEPSGSRIIKASEFKAKCLKLMDEVAETGGEIIIIKNGRPVSRLTPYRERAGDVVRRRTGQDTDTGGHRVAYARQVVRRPSREG